MFDSINASVIILQVIYDCEVYMCIMINYFCFTFCAHIVYFVMQSLLLLDIVILHDKDTMWNTAVYILFSYLYKHCVV